MRRERQSIFEMLNTLSMTVAVETNFKILQHYNIKMYILFLHNFLYVFYNFT